MAQAILSCLLKRLSSWTRQPSSSSSPPSSAETELQNLEETIEKIHGILEDAEEKGTSDESELLRLRELREVAYDAEDVVDECEYEVLRMKVEARRQAMASRTGKKPEKEVMLDWNSFHPKVSISNELAGRIKGIKKRLEEINDWDRIGLLLFEKSCKRRRIRKKWEPSETTSYSGDSKTFGREDEKNEIIKWLLQEEEGDANAISVMGIVGMGGLGKTTLAQMAYNDTRVCQHFKLRGWVYVSQDLDGANLVKKIYDSFVMSKGPNFMSLDEVHRALKVILDGKKFLLVLDDLWNMAFELWSSLKTLLVIARTGKILVTTRNQLVLRNMETTPPIYLSHLSFDDSWLLFKNRVFEVQDHDLLEIGKKIVYKCRGLPLAIKVLAGILREEGKEEVWNEVLESELWEFDKENDDNIFPILKLSYDRLPVELRQCFMYLSLFPKGSVLDKSIIVQQWMSNGFISPKGEKMEEDVGNDYCNEFLHRSILQIFCSDALFVPETFVMHDLIHDLAQSVAKDDYLLMTALNAHHMIPKTIRHLYVHMNEFGIIHLESLREAKHLRTLILSANAEIPIVDLLPNLRCLRTIVLPTLKLGELPDSIGNMKHLRYLDIGFCKSIPASIYKLNHLHTLKSSSVGIKLSREIEDLINLRHLIGFNGYHLPHGAVGLTNLQTAPRISLGADSDGNGLWKLRDLKGLRNLRGTVSVEGLETVAWADVVPPEAYFKDTRGGIKELTLFWKEVDNVDERLAAQVLDSLQPHRDLRYLMIYGYPGAVLPTWLGHELPALKELWIHGATRVKSFVAAVEEKREEFSSLNPPAVVSASASASIEDFESRRCFPSLEVLRLTEMDELEEWQGAEERDLPCLTTLKIKDCPKLKKLPSLPRLSSLRIKECPELKSLPSLPLLTDLDLDFQFRTELLTKLPMLRNLSIRWCLDETLIFPDDGSMNLIEKLSIRKCYDLRSVEGLSRLASLQQLEIDACPVLSTLRSTTGVPLLFSFTFLRRLVIRYCPRLRISPNERLPPNIQKVKIKDSKVAKKWYQNQVLSVSECPATCMEQDPMTV